MKHLFPSLQRLVIAGLFFAIPSTWAMGRPQSTAPAQDDSSQAEEELPRPTEASCNGTERQLGPPGMPPLFRGVGPCYEAVRRPFTRVDEACEIPAFDFSGTPLDTVPLERVALKNSYCQKKIPRRVERALEENQDVPATFISQWTPEYLRAQWEPLLRNSAQSSEVDLITLFELNLAAAELWSELLNCAQGDPEKARAAYGRGQFRCGPAGPDEAALRRRVASYIAQVGDFFSTSYFKASKPLVRNRFDLILKMGAGEDIVELPKEHFPTFHPLFAQVVEQLLVDLLQLGDDVSVRDFAADIQDVKRGYSERMFVSLGNVHGKIAAEACAPLGLWPSAARAVGSQMTWENTSRLAEMANGDAQEKMARAVDAVFRPQIPGPIGVIAALNPFSILARAVFVAPQAVADAIVVRDFGVVPNNCGETILPMFYKKHQAELARVYRGILQSYR